MNLFKCHMTHHTIIKVLNRTNQTRLIKIQIIRIIQIIKILTMRINIIVNHSRGFLQVIRPVSNSVGRFNLRGNKKRRGSKMISLWLRGIELYLLRKLVIVGKGCAKYQRVELKICPLFHRSRFMMK